MGCGSSQMHDGSAPESNPIAMPLSWPFNDTKEVQKIIANAGLDEEDGRALLTRFQLMMPDHRGRVSIHKVIEMGAVPEMFVEAPTVVADKAVLNKDGILARFLASAPGCQRLGYVDFTSFVKGFLFWRGASQSERLTKVFGLFDDNMNGIVELDQLMSLLKFILPDLSEQLIVDAADSVLLDSCVSKLLLDGTHREPPGSVSSASRSEFIEWCLNRTTYPKFGFNGTICSLDIERGLVEDELLLANIRSKSVNSYSMMTDPTRKKPKKSNAGGAHTIKIHVMSPGSSSKTKSDGDVGLYDNLVKDQGQSPAVKKGLLRSTNGKNDQRASNSTFDNGYASGKTTSTLKPGRFGRNSRNRWSWKTNKRGTEVSGGTPMSSFRGKGSNDNSFKSQLSIHTDGGARLPTDPKKMPCMADKLSAVGSGVDDTSGEGLDEGIEDDIAEILNA